MKIGLDSEGTLSFLRNVYIIVLPFIYYLFSYASRSPLSCDSTPHLGSSYLRYWYRCLSRRTKYFYLSTHICSDSRDYQYAPWLTLAYSGHATQYRDSRTLLIHRDTYRHLGNWPIVWWYQHQWYRCIPCDCIRSYGDISNRGFSQELSNSYKKSLPDQRGFFIFYFIRRA